MIAVEEKCFKSAKTDASLYNGQPTDTGAKCHSVGIISCTSSIQEEKDGVSVENVHNHSKQWFVLRVSYGRVLKAKEIIVARNIECYAPIRSKQITKYGKKHIIILVTSQNIQYKSDDHVIVTEGDFEGNCHLYASLLYECLADENTNIWQLGTITQYGKVEQ